MSQIQARTREELEEKSFTKAMLVAEAKDRFKTNLNISDKKTTLISKYLQAQVDLLGTSDHPDKMTPEQIEKEYPICLVKYVGHNSILEQNVNSTPSGTRYIFNNGQWTTVTEKDFKEKYYKKMKGAIDQNVRPHFQCARAKILESRKNDDGVLIHYPDYSQIFNFFEEELKAIVNTERKIGRLADFEGMDELKLIELQKLGINSIEDYVSVTDAWLIGVLKGASTDLLRKWRRDANIYMNDNTLKKGEWKDNIDNFQ